MIPNLLTVYLSLYLKLSFVFFLQKQFYLLHSEIKN